MKNLKQEMQSEIKLLKDRIQDIEKQVLQNQENFFADTVKVNFSNSKPIKREKTTEQSEKSYVQKQRGNVDKVSSIVRANAAVDLQSEISRNPFLDSEAGSKQMTLGGADQINLKNTITSMNMFNQKSATVAEPSKYSKNKIILQDKKHVVKDKNKKAKDLVFLNQKILKAPGLKSEYPVQGGEEYFTNGDGTLSHRKPVDDYEATFQKGSGKNIFNT